MTSSLRRPFVTLLWLLMAACGMPEATPAAVEVDGTTDSGAHQLDLAPRSLLGLGDFDSGTLGPWQVVHGTNLGLARVPVTQYSDLAGSGGNALYTPVPSVNTNTTFTVGAGGNVLAGLAAGASVRFPRYGQGSAVVNQLGQSKQMSALSANFVVGQGDLDPSDAKVHHRFVVAPVLQAPVHPTLALPFVYAQLVNQSRGGQPLGVFFELAGQAGVPWKPDSLVPTTLYTDWQIVDFTLSPNDVALGDTLGFTLIAAGCSQGGHFGEAYVDAVGSMLPGLGVTAAGPAAVNAGDTIDYTLTLSHHGANTDSNVVLTAALAANTTFVAAVVPQGMVCQTPAVGQAGNVVCSVGTFRVGETYRLLLDVKTAAGATAPVALYDYTLRSDAESPLVGPAVVTQLTQGVSYSNLRVVAQKSPNVMAAKQLAYDVTFINNGPSNVTGAHISDIVPRGLTPQSWTCAAQGAASCNGQAQASGASALQGNVSIAFGSALRCVVTVSIDDDAPDVVNYSALISAPNAGQDNHPEDNSSTWVTTLSRAADVAPLSLGQDCSADAECSSGICADGVCCSTPCTGVCNACSTLGLRGTCAPVVADAPFAGHGTCNGYVCDGPNGCLTRCSQTANCATGYLCSGGQCLSLSSAGRVRICRKDADCADGTFCAPDLTCQAPADQSEDNPKWVLKGAGLPAYGCATASTSTPVALLGLVGLLARRLKRRRRGHAPKAPTTAFTVLGALMACALTGSSAQAALPVQQSLPAGRFVPMGGLEDAWNVPAASVPDGITLGGLLVAHYGHDLVRLVAPEDARRGRELVRGQGVLDAGLALGWHKRLELAVTQSLALQQTHGLPFIDPALARGPKTLRWSDLRLVPKVNVYEGHAFAVGALAVVTLPTGAKDSYMGYGAVTVTPEAAVQMTTARGVRLLASAGYGLRPRRRLLNVDLHNAVVFGAAVRVPFVASRQAFAASLTARGEVGLGKRRAVANPIELHGGFDWYMGRQTALQLGGGTGLTNGYGAARWRVLLGFVFTPSWRRPEQALPAQDTPPAEELVDPMDVTGPFDSTAIEAPVPPPAPTPAEQPAPPEPTGETRGPVYPDPADVVGPPVPDEAEVEAAPTPVRAPRHHRRHRPSRHGRGH